MPDQPEPTHQALNSPESKLKFLERLYQELRQTQETRYKLSVLKIGFVTALLGLGGFKFEAKDILISSSLCLAPPVAELFDLLIRAKNYRICRMGAFIRTHLEATWIDHEWQVFVRENYSRFADWGSFGFTILTYIAAGVLLWPSKSLGLTVFKDILWKPSTWAVICWFVAVFAFFEILRLQGSCRIAALKDNNKLLWDSAQSVASECVELLSWSSPPPHSLIADPNGKMHWETTDFAVSVHFLQHIPAKMDALVSYQSRLTGQADELAETRKRLIENLDKVIAEADKPIETGRTAKDAHDLPDSIELAKTAVENCLNRLRVLLRFRRNTRFEWLRSWLGCN